MSGVAAAAGEERLTVLNTWRSMFGMRVLIALKEKGLQYDYQEEDLPDHKSELLLQSNPVHKKIPVLLHGAKPVCESLIIVEYIDETWPSPQAKLLPQDPYRRAMARFWADYVDKKVGDAGLRILWSMEGSDSREQAKRDLRECMVTLEGALRDVFGGGPYFGGEQLGFVDIALAPYLCWFHTYETLASFKVLEQSQCPSLCAWSRTVVQYPSVKEAFTISPPDKVFQSALALRKKYLGV